MIAQLWEGFGTCTKDLIPADCIIHVTLVGSVVKESEVLKVKTIGTFTVELPRQSQIQLTQVHE